MIVDLPTDVGEVIVSQPAVATVVMRTKTPRHRPGRLGGDTNIFFLDAAGNNISVLDIKVVPATLRRRQRARGRDRPEHSGLAHPRRIRLSWRTNRVVLSGTALSDDDLNKAKLIAAQFAGGADNVANIVTVAGNQQVMLKVTVAEVIREPSSSLASTSWHLRGRLITGLVNGTNAPWAGAPQAYADHQRSSPRGNIGRTVDHAAAQARSTRRSALQTLAEPTLTAMSGQTGRVPRRRRIPDAHRSMTARSRHSTFKQFRREAQLHPDREVERHHRPCRRHLGVGADAEGGFSRRRTSRHQYAGAKTTVE